MKVAYLGDKTSHSYAAASKLFSNEELVGFPTIRAVIGALIDSYVDVCVAPIENSIQGGVSDCLDMLISDNLYIVKEIVMPIHECLIVKEKTEFKDIKTVYSHTQALSQCEQWLKNNLPHADLIAVSSTSEGIKRIQSSSDAAIGSSKGASGIVLAEDIEDYSNNATRFVALKKTPAFNGDKVSVVFEAPNRPGGLVSALKVFEDASINLIRIESRPHKSGLGRYIFFVDFMFNQAKDKLMETFEKVSKNTGFLKFLGQYESINLSEVS